MVLKWKKTFNIDIDMVRKIIHHTGNKKKYIIKTNKFKLKHLNVKLKKNMQILNTNYDNQDHIHTLNC